MQTVNRDTALATAAVYQEMFGEPDGTIPATYQVTYSSMLYAMSDVNLVHKHLFAGLPEPEVSEAVWN